METALLAFPTRYTHSPFEMVDESDLLVARGDARASSPHTPQINLGQGTPDLPTPPHVLAAVTASLANPYIQYTAYDGIPELRAAIAAKLSRDNGLDYDPNSEIMATNGAQEAVFIALQAVLDPGDELLIGDPHYTVHDEICCLLGAKVVPVRSIPAHGLAYIIDVMAAAITPRLAGVAGGADGHLGGAPHLSVRHAGGA